MITRRTDTSKENDTIANDMKIFSRVRAAWSFNFLYYFAVRNGNERDKKFDKVNKVNFKKKYQSKQRNREQVH